MNLSFAPDGRRLAIEIDNGTQRDVWVYEWARDTLSLLTLDAGTDGKPVWTPDGRRIVFRSNRGGTGSTFNLYWQRADGTGDVQRLTESKNTQYAASWHPNGKFLAFYETNPPNGPNDPANGGRRSRRVFLAGASLEFEPMFSPDGRWIAYVSNQSGVEGDSFRADKPRLWSEKRFQVRPLQRSFDFHPDGDRFALAAAAESQLEAKQDKVVFIFNFFEELKRIAPVTPN